jgi:hypothetical protein
LFDIWAFTTQSPATAELVGATSKNTVPVDDPPTEIVVEICTE